MVVYLLFVMVAIFLVFGSGVSSLFIGFFARRRVRVVYRLLRNSYSGGFLRCTILQILVSGAGSPFLFLEGAPRIQWIPLFSRKNCYFGPKNTNCQSQRIMRRSCKISVFSTNYPADK